MAFKGLNASATLGALVRETTRSSQLPHLDGLIQTTANKVLPVRRESHRVNTILMAIRTFEALDQVAVLDIPDTDALVERASGDILGIRGDGDRSDTILDGQSQDARRALNIPQPNGSIATSRSNSTSIPREVQAVNILLVTTESVSDRAGLDIPDLL